MMNPRYFSAAAVLTVIAVASPLECELQALSFKDNGEHSCRSMNVVIEMNSNATNDSLYLSTCGILASRYRRDKEKVIINTNTQQLKVSEHSTYWGSQKVEDLTLVQAFQSPIWELKGSSYQGISLDSFKAYKDARQFIRLAACQDYCKPSGVFDKLCDIQLDCEDHDQIPSRNRQMVLCDALAPRKQKEPTRDIDANTTAPGVSVGADFRWSSVDVDSLRVEYSHDLKLLNATYCTKGTAPKTAKYPTQQAVNAVAAGTILAAFGSSVISSVFTSGNTMPTGPTKAAVPPFAPTPVEETGQMSRAAPAGGGGGGGDDDAAEDDAEDILDADVGIGVEDIGSDFAVFLAY